jgi:hypothetical protein
VLLHHVDEGRSGAFQWQRRAASAGVEGMPAGEFKFAALAPATNFGKRLRPSLGEAVSAVGKQPPAGDARPQPAHRLTPRTAGPTHWDNRARRDERSLGHAATKDWGRPHIGRSVPLTVTAGDAPKADALVGAVRNSYRHGGTAAIHVSTRTSETTDSCHAEMWLHCAGADCYAQGSLLGSDDPSRPTFSTSTTQATALPPRPVLDAPVHANGHYYTKSPRWSASSGQWRLN